MPLHVTSCSYGEQLLRRFVPGDDGNPWVALWQAGFLEMASLAVAALIVLYLAGSSG
jgi:hypothetical protein